MLKVVFEANKGLYETEFGRRYLARDFSGNGNGHECLGVLRKSSQILLIGWGVGPDKCQVIMPDAALGDIVIALRRCHECAMSVFLIGLESETIVKSLQALGLADKVLLIPCKGERGESIGLLHFMLIDLVPGKKSGTYQKLGIEIENKVNKTSSGGCYIATAIYGSYDCPPVWVLRHYRDEVLAQSMLGRLFIRAYYAVSPKLVDCFGESVVFKCLLRRLLDWKVSRLKQEGFCDAPYTDKEW